MRNIKKLVTSLFVLILSVSALMPTSAYAISYEYIPGVGMVEIDDGDNYPRGVNNDGLFGLTATDFRQMCNDTGGDWDIVNGRHLCYCDNGEEFNYPYGCPYVSEPVPPVVSAVPSYAPVIYPDGSSGYYGPGYPEGYYGDYPPYDSNYPEGYYGDYPPYDSNYPDGYYGPGPEGYYGPGYDDYQYQDYYNDYPPYDSNYSEGYYGDYPPYDSNYPDGYYDQYGSTCDGYNSPDCAIYPNETYVPNDYFAPPYPNSQYNDLYGHWAEFYILELTNRGILQGYPDGYFRPDQPVTRAEMVKIAMKASNLQTMPGDEDRQRFFIDLEPWQAPWVNAAYRLDIVEGYTGGYSGVRIFKPNNYVNRAESVKLVLAAFGRKPHDLDRNSFFDVHGWMVPWVEDAFRIGLFDASEPSFFYPAEPATRAEASQFIYRMMVYAGDVQ